MEGYTGKFVCYTDDPTGLDDCIETRELPKELEGWWGKLYLFSQLKEKTLFLDLDTVIVGGLDDIVAYDGDFAILRDFYRPNGLQSSFMLWNGDHSYIWDKWVEAGQPRVDGGDQAWIEKTVTKFDIWQDLYQGDFVSYKANHCQDKFPKGSKVVIFHGNPRPHEAGGWVNKVWKIGGGTTAELLLVANTSDKQLFENIDSNMALGLPELEVAEINHQDAIIVAGGPSLSWYISDIKAQQNNGSKVFAVNGTLDYLLDNGITPDYMVMLDARIENVGFVLREPDVEYLLCSQVHPRVFRYLEGKNIKVWHSAIAGAKPRKLQIGGATTVGLKAAVLAYVLGHRILHLYGFDSSYSETHHAYPQTLNDNERVVDVETNGLTFKCAAWMAQQANEFCDIAPELVRMGCEIQVHGYGLIPTIAINMERPRIAADDRAEEILARLPETAVTGVEIGVFTGDLSRRLLDREDLSLYMVDSWQGHGDGYIGDSGDFHAGLSQADQDRFHDIAHSVTSFAGDRAKIIRADSREAAKLIPDGSLDFVFIDADHSYDGCKLDIEAWFPKVKHGGLFSGHDYENAKYPKFGVTQAVNEFAQQHGFTVELGRDTTWFINPLQE